MSEIQGMPHAEQLKLLREFSANVDAKLRAAAKSAWVSVALAVLILTVLIVSGASALGDQKQRLRKAEAERVTIANEVRKLKFEVRGLNDEIAGKRAEVETLESRRNQLTMILSGLAESELKSIDAALSKDADAGKAWPRIYLTYNLPSDKERAKQVADALAASGFIVVRNKYERSPAQIAQTHVGYYLDSEKDLALKVVDLLKQEGLDAIPNLLKGTTRPNHIDISLATGVGTRPDANARG